LFAFYAFLFLSVTWVDTLQDPAIKVLRPTGDLAMALIVISQPDPRRAIMTVFRRCAILLIPMSVVLVKYYPWLGRMSDKNWGQDSWIGVTTHKNPLSQLCFVAAIGYVDHFFQQRRRGLKWRQQLPTLILLFLTGYLLFAGGENSRSSTTLLCMILAAGLYWLFGYMRKRVALVMRFIYGFAFSLGLVAVALSFAGTSLQAVVAGLFGKAPTLTDRTYLWADVIRIGGENPILGSGYGGFWVPSTFAKLSPEVDNQPMEAHNGYLETFANLGLVGDALLAWLILASVRDAARGMAEDFEYNRLRLTMLITVAVMNYSEATFPRGMHLWWFGFLVFAVSPRGFARPKAASSAPASFPNAVPSPAAYQPEPDEHPPISVPCRSLT
jgi:O-antigen ligase